MCYSSLSFWLRPENEPDSRLELHEHLSLQSYQKLSAEVKKELKDQAHPIFVAWKRLFLSEIPKWRGREKLVTRQIVERLQEDSRKWCEVVV